MQALDQEVARTHHELDRRTAAYLRSHGLEPSCRKGCHFCCYAMVVISLAEAEYLRAQLEPSRLAEAEQVGQKRLMQIARDKHQPNFATEYFLQANPCPLLGADGACCAYPHRPLACRGVLTDLDAHYCAPGVVLRLRGKNKSQYQAQLKPYHGPEHYLEVPWQSSQRSAQQLWEKEQEVRGFTVIGELATMIYLCAQEDFRRAVAAGPQASKHYLKMQKLLGGEWGFWVG
ncbi:MAG: YkgJ family cysteine cluster protein [Thermaceae bacterium]|nr:YkgJ family cysteine cluster protein [Thermaceae bacterium]